jgi:hypothetical protein
VNLSLLRRGLLALAALVMLGGAPFEVLAQEHRVTVRFDGRAVIRAGPAADTDTVGTSGLRSMGPIVVRVVMGIA